jgi:hypothetical protein
VIEVSLEVPVRVWVSAGVEVSRLEFELGWPLASLLGLAVWELWNSVLESRTNGIQHSHSLGFSDSRILVIWDSAEHWNL